MSNYKQIIQEGFKWLFLSGLLHLTFTEILEPNPLNLVNVCIGLTLTSLYFISH